MTIGIDYLIIGGGIVGLAVGLEIVTCEPSKRVVIMEKEAGSDYHASGRNSGVLHAGFYYSPDSIKAKITAGGNQLLKRFCDNRDIPFKEVGKYVVTRSLEEVDELLTLYERGISNGVPLEVISESELRRNEPLARTHKNALWSPSTAIADPSRVTNEVAKKFQELGGEIIYQKKITEISNGYVVANNEKIYANHIINSAGTYAESLAKQVGFAKKYITLPFLGTYVYTPELDSRFTSHIYPVPDKRNPFLGVHLTTTIDGRVKFGPTAVPVLSYEQYGFLSGLSARESIRTLQALPGFFSSRHHDVWSLVLSELPKISKSQVVSRGLSLIQPGISPKTMMFGKPGIRAQLFDTLEKRLEMDFVIEGDHRTTHILNAVSPGWTSSLAFAKLVYQDVRNRAN